ncbi:YdiY family protein [Pleionea sp. CnH1-48]|uniref:DUF481 domain-containing protein n=1 Tax=Pleionea sp. CnH1-48 TaxID=2954494 RepID=UPI002096D485|nr:DUF481 domain-containing protein [Pleionea sp. CnH1-48]MCO7227176.1 DUF481 domain-containing protein [Pleionea sp. CnH1-48]
MKKLAFLLSALPIVAFAGDAEENKLWKGKAEAGLVSTTGNTDTSSTNLKLELVYESGDWRHSFLTEAFLAEAEQVVGTELDGQGNLVERRESRDTGEKYYTLIKSDYKFSETAYFYGLVDYTDDRFSGFDYQANASVGLGKNFIKNDKYTLDAEIGYGARRYQEEAQWDAETEGVTRVAGKFQWNISENAKFNQELNSQIGDDITVSKSISALTANINSSMALSIGYEIVHTSDVPSADIEKTDRKTTVNLVYSF